jgi:hypothetical protein
MSLRLGMSSKHYPHGVGHILSRIDVEPRASGTKNSPIDHLWTRINVMKGVKCEALKAASIDEKSIIKR